MAMVLVFFLVENQAIQEQQQQERQERIGRLERGTACPALARAERAMNTDDSGSFATAIKAARRRAEHALDTSGVFFGAPERHAMFLAEELNRKESARTEARIRERLAAAVEACDRDVTS
jgi:hypothetical protein